MKMHKLEMTAVAVLALALAGGSASAAVVASDTFTLGSEGSGREVGDPIAGTTSETGGLTWAAPATGGISAVFGSDGTAVDNAEENSRTGAYVAFTPASDMIYTLSVDVDAAYDAGESTWIAVVFGSNADRPTIDGAGEMWLAFRRNGTFDLFANSTTSLYDSGTDQAPDLNTTGFNNVSLEWDVAAAELTLWLNGSEITTVAQPDGVTVTHAGFWIDGAAGEHWGQVDNFSLTEVVPEPTSLVLLGLGGLAAFRRRRVS